MFSPSHIFFDLDHTLWDFETNSRETLVELMEQYRDRIPVSIEFEDFMRRYEMVNQNLWSDYRRNIISQSELREKRFVNTFDQMGIVQDAWMEDFGDDYLRVCPTKGNLMEGTHEILQFLSSKVPLHIISNGFAEVQAVKMETAGLNPYFQHIITSENAAAKKPDPAIFEFALGLTGAMPNQSAYIGDDYETDVIGGVQAGFFTVYFNPAKAPNPLKVPEIRRLSELESLFSF